MGSILRLCRGFLGPLVSLDRSKSLLRESSPSNPQWETDPGPKFRRVVQKRKYWICSMPSIGARSNSERQEIQNQNAHHMPRH
jgi:hypothetical protein